MVHFLARLLALIFGKVAKCMRLGMRVLLGMGFAWAASSACANPSDAVLIAPSEQGLISARAYFWHEKPGKASIDQVADAAKAARFMPLQEEKIFDLKPEDRLWIRLEVDKKGTVWDHTTLWLPLPLLDSVTVYQPKDSREVKGNELILWKSMRAGDRIAVANWPEPGRYPRFHLELPPGKSTVYLQVQSSTPLSLPIHMGTELQAQVADREGFLGLGLIAGVLLTLVLVCFVTAYTYQDRLYLLYGFYMLVMVLAVGAYTGISAYLIWNQSPVWADAAQGALAFVTAGGALYFIEAMLGGRQFAQRLSIYLFGLSGASLPLALIYCFMPRTYGVILLGVYMALISSIGLTLAARAWRRGDQVGKWIFVAYTPLALAVLMAVARAFGWISVSWVVQYGVVIALLIEAPMMMVALHVRSRERHEIGTREQAMATQDALTGLLKEHIFDDRIKQTLARYTKRREDAAIVLISLVNYQNIVDAHGLPVAEQSVLRCVIKLRRVLRDIDTLARVGTSQFGLILEGNSHRAQITEIGARLIAQGLMPLPGLIPEVTLQFHLATVILREVPSPNPLLKQELQAVLSSMSRRTRRPIRFLDAATITGMPLTSASSETLGEAASQELEGQLENLSRSTQPMPGSTLQFPLDSDWDSSNQDPSSTTGDTVILPR